MILTEGEILIQMHNLRKNGLPKPFHVGFKSMDENIGFIRGGCTDITGYPFGGKSLLLKEIIVSLSLNHNWKHLVYMPDDGTETEVLSNLIYKMFGKSIVSDFNGGLSEEQVTRYTMQALKHFVFLKGIAEPKQLWEYAKENKCDSAVIDSWNYLAHQGEATSPEYLRKILSYRNTFFQENKMHSFIIIHPKNPDPMAVKEGSVKRPTVYHIMGGSEWNNNGKNIMVCHKMDKSNYSEPYSVSVDKIKPKHAGRLGEFTLNIDWQKQKFYEMDNYYQIKKFAYGQDEQVNDPMNDLGFQPIIEDEPF